MTDADFTADRVIRITTDYRWDQRDRPVSPTTEQVLSRLPANFRLGSNQKWQILVRGKDTEGSTAEDVIANLASVGIKAAEVEREGIEAVYQFRTGKDGGSGSFLSPPGHAALTYSIYGYHSSGKGRPRTDRPSGPDTIMSIESLAEDEGGYYPKWAVEKAKRILAESTTEPSEAWVQQVYGYFKHSYSPDGTDRNVSNAISSSKLHCKCGEEFWSQRALNLHIDLERGRARGPKGRPARGNAGHYEIAVPTPPAEHHLGYLCVKGYFPEHTPRLDLIEGDGSGYGSRPCIKCGENVQYEARHDGWAKVRTTVTGLWGGTDPVCPKDGGKHEVRPHNGPCENCGCEA
jgi:hypothetical protein